MMLNTGEFLVFSSEYIYIYVLIFFSFFSDFHTAKYIPEQGRRERESCFKPFDEKKRLMHIFKSVN
jgi:hypothetical protein